MFSIKRLSSWRKYIFQVAKNGVTPAVGGFDIAGNILFLCYITACQRDSYAELPKKTQPA
jgi:hypothetical protein